MTTPTDTMTEATPDTAHDHDTDGSQRAVLDDFDQTNGIIERTYGADASDEHDEATTTREIHTANRKGRARR